MDYVGSFRDELVALSALAQRTSTQAATYLIARGAVDMRPMVRSIADVVLPRAPQIDIPACVHELVC